MFNGNGRTVLIDGLGNPSTVYLLRQGYNVALCAHSQEQADKMAATVPEEYRSNFTAQYCMTDDPESIKKCIEAVVERFGSLDVIVNGAGKLENSTFDETDYETFSDVVSSHQRGVFNVTKAALPALLKGRSPRVINFTYVEGKCGKFDCGFSSAVGKGGIVAMTRAIALEYAHTGLTANCIAIAAMETLHQRSPERIKELESVIPVGRIATAADIAPAICFLASEESGYMTGAVLNMSGGAYMD